MGSRWRVLAYISLLAVLSSVLSGCGQMSGRPTLAPLVMSTESVVQQTNEIELCGVVFKILKSERQPGTGAKDTILLTLSLTNVGQKTYPVVPYDIYLSDSTGKTTKLAFRHLKDALEGGSLKPGSTMSGDVSYDVPKEAEDLHIVWLPGWCSEKVFVQLADE